jgi:hypothetical protein
MDGWTDGWIRRVRKGKIPAKLCLLKNNVTYSEHSGKEIMLGLKTRDSYKLRVWI